MSNNFLDALAGRPHDRVPYQELQVSPHHVEAILGRSVQTRSGDLYPDDAAEFALATGQEAVYYNALWKAGRVYEKDSSGKAQYVDGSVKCTDDLKKIEPFDIEDACAHVEKLCKAAAANGLATVISLPPPFRLALYATGYETFFIGLVDDRTFIDTVIDYFQERAEQYLDALLQHPVDGFLLSGSLCTGSGPMFSPEIIRDIWMPGTQRFIEPILRKGVALPMHCDGDFTAIADMILELPIDALHPFEVTGNLDIYRFKETYGDRVTVWGNIDLAGVLTRGTPEQVRADVKAHIDRLAPGHRYVLGSSHEIAEDVPMENFLALIDAAQEFGDSSG